MHENPSGGSRVVPRGWTDGQADVTKLMVAFRNFANASKSDGLLSSLPNKYNNNQIICNDQSCKIHTKSRYTVIFIVQFFKYFLTSQHVNTLN